MDKNPIRLKYSDGLSCAIVEFYFKAKGIEAAPGLEFLEEPDPKIPSLMEIEIWGPCDIRVRRNPYLHEWIPAKEYHSLEEYQKDVETYPAVLREKVKEVDVIKKYTQWKEMRELFLFSKDHTMNSDYQIKRRDYLRQGPVHVTYRMCLNMLQVFLWFDFDKTEDGYLIRPGEKVCRIEIHMAWNVVDSCLKLINGMEARFYTGDDMPLERRGEDMSYTDFAKCVQSWPQEIQDALEKEDLSTMFKVWEDQVGHYVERGYRLC